MHSWSTLPRPLLAALATLLAIVATLYSFLWMYDVRRALPQVELGFNRANPLQNAYDRKTHSLEVLDLVPESPAEQAGLQIHDRIVEINGRPLVTMAPFDEAWSGGRPGDMVELTIQREGETKPLILRGVFRAALAGSAPEGLAKTWALELTGLYPVLFLVVGIAVLFLRIDDPNAWLLALLFCGFIAVPGFPNAFSLPSPMREFGLAYRAIFDGMVCSLFYLFFAVFPVRSPLDRRVPWLKWVSLAMGVLYALQHLRIYSPLGETVSNLVGNRNASVANLSWRYGLLALGMISLAANAVGNRSSPESSRKARVIFWGTVFGILPIVVELAAIDFVGYRPPFWLDTVLVLVVLLYPLSFAYAVVKYRVMEIPVLLRISARYVLVQRGFVLLLFIVGASAIAIFTHTFSRYFQSNSNTGMALSAVFGIALVWVAAPMVRRGTERIDRAFFRSAYDARIILQDLAKETRMVSDRHELSLLLENHLREALHPKTLFCYLQAGDARLVAECETVSPALETLPAGAPVLIELARRGKSQDVPPPGSPGSVEFSLLAPLEPECLVPILERSGGLIGFLVLGPRLSEEPYSGEDKRLLDSVASQAGIALENIQLAEKMAERMEAERRSVREFEMARQVQARLFPQKFPSLRTLEYAGRCIQARQVGGDYYDFLELAPGRCGFLLADIAGKGFSGALLMANLQANLRSQYAAALENLPGMLESVNRFFYENTADDAYATLFFADYEDATGRMRYANCGHVSPLILRADGTVEWLESTCTVLGLFESWRCSLAEVAMAPKDTLILYSDGVTEAAKDDGEEFGRVRLLDTVRANKDLAASLLLEAIVAAVQIYGGAEQADDLTLVVARGR
jgi:phosphoserine phosphatase RsbU/P